jgi:uncharacterized protein YegL
MSGAPIEAVRQGVKALLADLRSDQQALETAHLAVILFDSTARYVCPLTELEAFREPELEARGSSALGAALRLLNQCLEQDLIQPNANPSGQPEGDWYPLIFIMTDGRPTDNWQSEAAQLKQKIGQPSVQPNDQSSAQPNDQLEQKKQKKLGIVVACAAGDTANLAVLQELTETVLELNGLYPEALWTYFRWMSDSEKSTPVSSRTRRTPSDLPPPPARVRVVP